MASVKENTATRIPWITGLKGLACYGVFLHHLFLNIDGDTYYGTASSGLTWLLSSTPIGILNNGNFYVYLFLTLSGYLIGNTFVNYEAADLRSKIGTFALKRYFRLMLPILTYALLRQGFVLLWNSLLGDCRLPAYPSWSFAIEHSVYDVFAYEDTALAGPLWMMNHLFAGSYIALLVSLLDRTKNKLAIALIYCIAFCFMIKQCDYYLAAAMFGVLLVDLQPLLLKIQNRRVCHFVSTLLILVGLFLGGVPSTLVPYPFFFYRSLVLGSPIWHLFAALLLLLGILGKYALSGTSQTKPAVTVRFLQTAPLQFLGKISYSMFLVHEAVLVLLYDSLHELCEARYRLSAGATIAICIVSISAVTVLVSWLFYLIVERNTNKLCNRIRV